MGDEEARQGGVVVCGQREALHCASCYIVFIFEP